MQDFVIMGESLIELTWPTPNQAAQGFAGDVYSVAVYLKRANPNVRARLLCGIGQDALSHALVQTLQAEGVDTSLLLPHPTRHLGLYAINNDASGERNFIYWRSESAARHTLQLLMAQHQDLLIKPPSWFYFTGISLAILEPADRALFWPLLAKLRASGTKVVFDTNYRAKLWPNAAAAQAEMANAFALSDLILPGLDDFNELYAHTTAEQVASFLADFKDTQLVIKNGAEAIYYGTPKALSRFDIEPVHKVVDTTAAGDSFAGTLLGHLAAEATMAEAVAAAAHIASRVIGHKGAILPTELYPYKAINPRLRQAQFL
ncbi:sugar kinase [Simiduia litorea]|uniref:sugar kinase n=1 Tax=Simiduia litorea TaxID=1435348 RepID=UPI0036F38868